MKRAFFLLWIAILIAGCGEGPLGKGALNGLDNDPGDETGGLFGGQSRSSGEGIPLEDDAAAEGKKPAAPKPNVQAVIKPVEITKAGGNLGTCVIGEACEKKISAKGGSGEYVWTLVEGVLPKGLELSDQTTQKVKIKKKNEKNEDQEIDEVGEFVVKLRVEDKADAERSAERTFTLKIEEHLSMDLYTMAENEDGQKVWTPVQEKDENGNAVPITVAPKGILLAQVIGHAPSYRWSINWQEVVCNDQTCTGTKDGLTLQKDTNLSPPEPHPEHFAYMILRAEEAFIGVEKKNVVIAVAQDYGDPASKTISSITFQQEPCKIELAVTGGSTDVKRIYGKPYEIGLRVEGGSGPVTWTPLKDAASVPKEKATLEPKGDGRQAIVSGKIDARDGMKMAEYLAGEQIQLQYQVEDGCAPKNAVTVNISVSVKGDEDVLRVDPAERSSSLHLGANDTDSSSKMTLFLTDEQKNNFGWWESAIGLDQYGDGECGWFCYDINANHSVSQPAMKFVSPLRVDQMSHVLFVFQDPGSGGWVDVKINEYSISFPHWSGAAQGVNYDMNDIDDGSDRFFGIQWTYKN